MSVPYDASGPAPLTWSLATGADLPIVATALKLAEGDNDLVIRTYEPRGRPSELPALAFGKAAPQIVNFIEDAIPGGDAAGANALSYHPFEIKTLKITRPASPQ
jgi:alpha-mannosidase